MQIQALPMTVLELELCFEENRKIREVDTIGVDLQVPQPERTSAPSIPRGILYMALEQEDSVEIKICHCHGLSVVPNLLKSMKAHPYYEVAHSHTTSCRNGDYIHLSVECFDQSLSHSPRIIDSWNW